MARAISKNGSIAAYVLTGANLSLYLTILIAILITAAFRLHKMRPKPGACPFCGYLLRGAPGPSCPECGQDVRDLLKSAA